MKRKILCLLIISMLLYACKTTEDENAFESSNLPGMIYDGKNQSCKMVKISIYKVGVFLYSVESDINGRFTLPGLERGEYEIVAKKEGYETLETSILYSSPLEVVYLKIYSQNQILDEAEKALEMKRFDLLKKALERSSTVNEDDPIHLYMNALYFYHLEDSLSSLESLNRILEFGYDFPFVQLLMADNYQYLLEDRKKAVEALERFLTDVDHMESKKRLEELQQNETI